MIESETEKQNVLEDSRVEISVETELRGIELKNQPPLQSWQTRGKPEREKEL